MWGVDSASITPVRQGEGMKNVEDFFIPSTALAHRR